MSGTRYDASTTSTTSSFNCHELRVTSIMNPNRKISHARITCWILALSPRFRSCDLHSLIVVFSDYHINQKPTMATTTALPRAVLASSILSVKYGAARTTHHTPSAIVRQRLFSSAAPKEAVKPPTPPPKPDSGNNFMWHAATAAAFGITFIGVRYGLKNMNMGDEEDAAGSADEAVPQADIISKVYFDVSIDQQPAGRIIMGLYGGVVPQTAKNFETLCKGNEKKGDINLSYSNTIFHR